MITSLDDYIASVKQRISIIKTASRTTVAALPFSLFDIAGNPGAGVLSIGNTANGVVPNDTIAGFPLLDSFTVGAIGYLSKIEFGSTVASRIALFDRLWHAGSYSYAAGTTALSSQPSFSARVPGGTNYSETQIWIEVATAFVTGTAWQVQVTYTNQSGVAGRTSIISTAAAASALTLGKTFQIALQSGDTGVQKIQSVIVTNGGTAMTAGAFNVLILRPLWSGRIPVANSGDVHDMLRTGLVQVFADSALFPIIYADSTASGIPELNIEISNK